MNSTVQYLQQLRPNHDIEVPVLIDCVLADAVSAGATDIHIEPWENTVAVRIRVDGVLTELVHLPLDLQERICACCKVLASLETFAPGLPQEGHIPASPRRGNVDFRISTFPCVRGEKVAIRIFDPGSRKFDLDTLGFEPDTLTAFTRLLARPSGLLLLTGPTGSGKTTTIYSALTHILQRAGPAVSLASIEDPVEVWLPMVTQSQVNTAKGFTYPVALRALLRQDPQVILVGEIRDAETAQIALQAGLTGHLVISTVHSSSSAGVFARLINMDIEPFLLASSLSGVLGVRLLRDNCRACRQPDQPEPRLLAFVPGEVAASASFMRGTGCPECHDTGFAGRALVAELLVVDEVLREALLRKLPSRALQSVAVEQGLVTLWQMGLRRVARGDTSLAELARVVTPDSG